MFNRVISRLIDPTVRTQAPAALSTAAKVLATIGITSSFVYSLIYAKTREHDIKASPFTPGCEDIVKDLSKFQVLVKPDHGTLKSRFLRDTTTGYIYVEKGAHSPDTLIKEYMVGEFLRLVNPLQPEILIEEHTDKNGTHFHTLSRKFPHTQDLEEFVRSGKTHELLEKRVTGLESAFAADQLVGKQSDTKLANMVVQDNGDELVFYTIDNERAASASRFLRLFDPTKPECPTSPRVLAWSIHDADEKSEDNQAGLAGDPRAKEFAEVAERVMDPDKIKDYFRTVANTDTDPVIKNCHRLASHSTLFTHSTCDDYAKLFEMIKQNAADEAGSQTSARLMPSHLV